MDNKQLNNTITEIVTPSGEAVKMTLNFFLLYGVKTKFPETYKQYNKIMMNNMEDVFDAMTILYTAYLCALPEGEEPKPYEDFMQLFEDDIMFVMSEAMKLIGRKKKAGSATRS